MGAPYRGTVESDIEATKAREAEEERLAKMTPLDRAKLARDHLRQVYWWMAATNVQSDPVKRAAQNKAYETAKQRWLDAETEVLRLLDARNGGR